MSITALCQITGKTCSQMSKETQEYKENVLHGGVNHDPSNLLRYYQTHTVFLFSLAVEGATKHYLYDC